MLETKEDAGHSRHLLAASILMRVIVVGYAFPWIAIGSLVSYLTAKNGCRYFVAVYVAYYLPGLPVAVAQTRFDQRFDARFTSKTAFWFRGVVSWAAKLVLVCLSRVSLLNARAMLPLTAGLGITTWCLHGSTSQLAQLLPNGRGVVAQQLGFALPAVLAFAGVEVLGIGTEASSAALSGFFASMGFTVVMGAVAWGLLLRSPLLLRELRKKDRDVVSARFKGGVETVSSSRSKAALLEHRLLSDDHHSFFEQHDQQDEVEPHEAAASRELSPKARAHVVQRIRPALVSLGATIFCSVFSAAFFPYVPSDGSSMTSRASMDLAELLYFVRLAADLLGRPLVVLNHGVSTMERLQAVSLIRVAVCATFVLYTLLPRPPGTTSVSTDGSPVDGDDGSPGLPWVPTSDLFVVLLSVVFFGGSGFLSILAYALAASALEGNAERAYSGSLLNQCFQASMFAAVVASELVAMVLPNGNC